MSLVRGMMLIGFFAVLWGTLSGLVAAFLRWQSGELWTTLSFAIGFVAAFSVLGMMDLCSRRFRRRGAIESSFRGDAVSGEPRIMTPNRPVLIDDKHER